VFLFLLLAVSVSQAQYKGKLTVKYLKVNSTSTLNGAVTMNGALATTGALTATGGITSGSDIISDTDGTDDLGSATVRWNAGYFDELFANKGADVASAATSMALGADGNYFDITGTTGIDSIAAQAVGKMVVLQFDGIVTVTDGGNLKLEGNFVSAAGATLVLISDGTDWYEISRAGGNVAVAGAATFASTVAATGAITATGGIAYPTNAAFQWADGGGTPLATHGTDAAATAGGRFWTGIQLLNNKTLTGIFYLIGSVGGTDSVVVDLYNSAGTLVASSYSGAAGPAAIVGTAANIQKVAFTSTYAAVAGTYYISIQFNGTTAKFRAYPIPGSAFIAATAAGTFRTAAGITPGTTFTADVGPISGVY
jgi:uncharacterized protein (UPF0333 family)